MNSRTIVIAGNYLQARNYAREQGLRNGEWLFPFTPEDLTNFRVTSVVYVGDWTNRSNAEGLKQAAEAALKRGKEG